MDSKSLMVMALVAVAVLVLSRDHSPKEEPFFRDLWRRITGKAMDTIPGYAKLYEHRDLQGASVNVRNSIPDLSQHGWNDKVSSIYVPKGYVLKFYMDPNYGGHEGVFSAGNYRFVGGWWNDKISSLKLVPA